MGEGYPEDDQQSMLLTLGEVNGELVKMQTDGGQVFRADTRGLVQAVAVGPDGESRLYNCVAGEPIGTMVDELKMVGVTRRGRGCLRRFVELASPGGVELGDKIVFKDKNGQRIRSAKIKVRPRVISLGQEM